MTNARLTENLLLLARSDKVIKLQKKLVDLNLLLSELMQLYKSLAQEKQLLLKLELEPDIYLLGDRILLKQLFTNLIQNALHYTPLGGLVIVKAIKTNFHVNIKIEDTGIGIASEHLEQIFERFWRADKSRFYQLGRSGLGLAIVKEIVRLHNGTISVNSELGKGSCFNLYFFT